MIDALRLGYGDNTIISSACNQSDVARPSFVRRRSFVVPGPQSRKFEKWPEVDLNPRLFHDFGLQETLEIMLTSAVFYECVGWALKTRAIKSRKVTRRLKENK